ncbi:MAG: FAD-binding protein [Polynucleobacter sp.]|uniref:L-aspartate oxidase n=1 Tax=Polynucleobacter sp. TaxID=2029855 RepID=UPI00271825C0|nr:FAD-binding protein [Polynucleobacter sp.]MDO8713463.1 FAD-binding protein [Polynucleobacter sp.]
MSIATHETDILILGSGGAGLFAALHAHQTNPDLHITIAVKGLLGKCGCTRMVQGGYNVALAEGDSVERHFMDTIEGGKWLSDQDLAWTLVSKAVERIHELENELGCFFDRNPDGTVHQKAFAGQTFDRTVHKGDLTGIEIINRLAEQVWSRGIDRLEEHRAVELIHSTDGKSIAGVLMLNMQTGQFTLVRAKAVLLATGGGPTMYKYHTPSGDKSCDGLAMALRAGLTLRDMEMVQFHPTGLLAGSDTRMTGTVLEEGLRGAGGYLLNGNHERFMGNYDPRNERATRDIVSRSINSEIRAGRATPNGGAYIQMSHLGPDNVRKQFKGMVERCADSGFDLAGDLVEVVPTAHYMMGGLVFKKDCSTELSGLFAAGEDTGGVHGANRLGGNGVANSTVYGGIAGEEMARWVGSKNLQECNMEEVFSSIKAHEAPLERPAGDIELIRDALAECMWDDVGISRTRDSLLHARDRLQELGRQLDQMGVGELERQYSVTWQDWMNLRNLILVSKAVTEAALARENSRGAHYRDDFPLPGSLEESYFTAVNLGDQGLKIEKRPVQFTMIKPGETILIES